MVFCLPPDGMYNLAMGENKSLKIISRDGTGLPLDSIAITERAMQVGVPEADIHRIAVMVDSKFRLITRGMHWPNALASKRFQYHEDEGPVISIGTKLRGRKLTKDEIDETLTHELVHAAQELDPNSKKISIGLATRIGSIVVGLALGYKFAGVKGATAGLLLGDRIGYTYGLHEIEARRKTKKIVSSDGNS